MSKVINAPTLDEVNSNLLIRLNELIQDADAADLLQITESIAKLNSSWKGNSQFGQPLSEEEKMKQQQQEMLADLLSGEVVDG